MGTRTARLVALLMTLVLVASTGCGGSDTGDGDAEGTTTSERAEDPPETTEEEPDEPTDTTLGDDGREFELDEIPEAVIEDLEAYWDEEMPEAYGIPYEPVGGGFFPYNSEEEPPSCGGLPTDYELWVANAFYCQPDDLVAWDEEELLPLLMDDYGPYAIAMVFAHEWGHAIQARAETFLTSPIIVNELQADCFAGAWTGWVYEGNSDTLTIDDAAFGQALGGLVYIRDEPGTLSSDEAASPHGSAFDRISAFQDGFEQGAERCTEYVADLPPPLDLSFASQEDLDSGGNLALEDTLDLTLADLNAYWSSLLPEDFEPIEGLVPYEVGDGDVPECDGDLEDEGDQDDQVIYCVDDNVIAFDVDFVSEIHETIGDMGVAALFAREFGTAAQIQTDTLPDDVLDALTIDLCFTGSWAADIYGRDPATVEPGLITSLSPGDLDEIILVYASFGDTSGGSDDAGSGAGIVPFLLVGALRDGFFGGEEACGS